MHGVQVKHAALWLTLITLLGLGLRLAAYFRGGAFAYFAFGDEILAYERALDYAAGIDRADYLSQANLSAAAKIPGSLWATFWLFAMRLGGGPHAVAGVMLVMNVAVILMVYLLGVRMLDQRGGLWAALFTATQPWVVYYSVGAYNPEVMAFFAGLTMLALWSTITAQRSPQVFWTGLLPLMALQFHFSAVMLAAATGVVLWFARRRVNRGALTLGILAGILLYWPYFRNEYATGWANTRGIFGAPGRFSFGCLKAITTPPSLLTAWCKRWTLPDYSDYLAMGDAVCGSYLVMYLFKALGTLLAAVFIAGFILEAVRAWRSAGGTPGRLFERQPAILMMLAFLLVPPVIFLITTSNYSSRYAIFQIPVLMLIPAMFMTRRAPRMRYSRAWLAMVTLVTGFHVYFLLGFFNHQGRLIAGNEKFVPSFKRLAPVYAALKNDAGAGRAISVTDLEFLEIHHDHDARAISLYVTAREKDARLRGLIDPALVPAAYVLMPAGAEGHGVYSTADIKLVRHAGTD